VFAVFDVPVALWLLLPYDPPRLNPINLLPYAFEAGARKRHQNGVGGLPVSERHALEKAFAHAAEPPAQSERETVPRGNVRMDPHQRRIFERDARRLEQLVGRRPAHPLRKQDVSRCSYGRIALQRDNPT
jgi:hypothetical protein